MLPTEMDRMVDEHFAFEAADDVEGVLATLTDDATHHLVGSPYGELTGTDAIRAFDAELFATAAGERVEPIARRYGDHLLVDESEWTGVLYDARLFGFPGRSGRVTFRLLHVLELHDGRIRREQVWPDAVAIERALS